MRFAALAALVSLLTAAAPDDPKPVAIRDAIIVVSPEETIEKGTVVLRNGLIESVGAEVEIPFDAEIIDGKDLVVYAGFFDGHTALGLPEEQRTAQETEAASSGKPDFKISALAHMEPANRKGIFPEFRACAAIAVKKEDVKSFHRAGFTTAVSAPPGQILGGTSTLHNLSGAPRRKAILRPDVAMAAGLRAPGKGYPGTLMAALAQFRQTMLDARRYRALHVRFLADPRGMPRPPFDPALEALQPVLAGKIPVAFEVNTLNDIRRALSLAKEFKLKVWIVGGAEAYKAADEPAERKVPVVLSLKWPDEIEPDDVLPEPRKLLVERKRLREERVRCAVTLHEKGVPFVFSSKGLSPADTLKHVRELIEKGLPPEAAVRALTTTPAELFGVGSIAGRIEPGRIADLTVLTGRLEDRKSRVRYVFVDGRKFEIKEKAPVEEPEIEVTGTWSISVEWEGGSTEGKLELRQSGSEVTGKISSELGVFDIEDGIVEGRRISFSVTAEIGDESARIEFTGEMKEKDLSGKVKSPMGEGRWKATGPE